MFQFAMTSGLFTTGGGQPLDDDGLLRYASFIPQGFFLFRPVGCTFELQRREFEIRS